jgi:long-chain acyl-CoA synthetase
MYQGYGLTEAAPIISCNASHKHKLGSSGFIAKYLEIKICDDNGNSLPVGEKGEIVVKGENVMLGYWKNENASKEVLKDGWLYTGDMGFMDADGFLYVLGRFKSLLISDDGEKYSPESIEEAFETSKLIEQVMLYNNQKPYTVALIYPNKEAMKRVIKEHGKDLSTNEGIEIALKAIELDLNQYRAFGKHGDMFPQRWLPPAIGILSEGFTDENRMMNSTMKMVRPKIMEVYADLLNYLYTPEAKTITNERNMQVMKKLLI